MKKSLLLIFGILLMLSASVSAEIKLKSLSKKKWTFVESENFQIVTDYSEAKATNIVSQLEQYRAFCLFYLNRMTSEISSGKLTIFLTDRKPTWSAMGMPKDAISFYSALPNQPSYLFAFSEKFLGSDFSNLSSGRTVVLNAITQDLFDRLGLDYPVWFQKGFALYLSTYTEHRGKIELGNIKPYVNRFATALKFNGTSAWFDTENIFKRNKETKIREQGVSRTQWLRDENRFYMQSLITVHYLYADDERISNLYDYLDAVLNGVDQDVALQDSFDLTYKKLDSALLRYQKGIKTIRTLVLEDVMAEIKIPTAIESKPLANKFFFKLFGHAVLTLDSDFMSNETKQNFLNSYHKNYTQHAD